MKDKKREVSYEKNYNFDYIHTVPIRFVEL